MENWIIPKNNVLADLLSVEVNRANNLEGKGLRERLPFEWTKCSILLRTIFQLPLYPK